MQHDILDRYSRGSSPLHRLHSKAKVILAVLLLLFTISLHPGQWIACAAVAAILMLAALIARIPVSYLLRRMLIIEPLIVTMALLALFRPDGIALFLMTTAKANVCFFIIIILSNTTPFARLLDVARSWHAPAMLVNIIALMYRYIFVLADETERMQRARSSRTFRSGKRVRWISRSQIIGQTFVRSTERAERIYAAMCARGWK
ncbi:MAG: cobalt ECF transporter T component CbiQ [Ignavibacteriales bacterium]|nr:cobalt ECF transporter T component CbiQ [Ignavibacteriales bacterium]